MKLNRIITAGLLASVVAAPSMAADALTAGQKKQVEQIVHEYLVQNPEILVEVSQALQQKQQQSIQEKAKASVTENAAQLFSQKLAVAGNPKGNVTLVEFFDYQCIHCKKMKPVISELVKNNKNLRVLYKEFPIFGKNSEMASKAALAAAMQGKYLEMHNALLAHDKKLNEKTITELAQSVGLNMEQFKKDMDSEQVTQVLKDNRDLAEKMNLMGTPAFIVASTPNGQLKKDSQPSFIPGAASQEALENLVKQASK